MKAVLISIRPKWCEMIASGKKTIEVRKTRPKLETPFKCYIYCTKDKRGLDIEADRDPTWLFGTGRDFGKVIGEFVCDSVYPLSFYTSDASFFDTEPPFPVPGTCLTDKEIAEYLGNGKTGYGWHISDLVIYDVPKKLSEFMQCHKCEYKSGCKEHEYSCDGTYKVTRPPQSFAYVEELP